MGLHSVLTILPFAPFFQQFLLLFGILRPKIKDFLPISLGQQGRTATAGTDVLSQIDVLRGGVYSGYRDGISPAFPASSRREDRRLRTRILGIYTHFPKNHRGYFEAAVPFSWGCISRSPAVPNSSPHQLAGTALRSEHASYAVAPVDQFGIDRSDMRTKLFHGFSFHRREWGRNRGNFSPGCPLDTDDAGM